MLFTVLRKQITVPFDHDVECVRVSVWKYGSCTFRVRGEMAKRQPAQDHDIDQPAIAFHTEYKILRN